MSLRDTILAATDVEHRDREVAEWGVTVRVRAFNLRELALFLDMAAKDSPDSPSVQAQALVWCLLDPETGRPIFGPSDVSAIDAHGAAVLAPLWRDVRELSHLEELGQGKAPASARSDGGATTSPSAAASGPSGSSSTP